MCAPQHRTRGPSRHLHQNTSTWPPQCTSIQQSSSITFAHQKTFLTFLPKITPPATNTHIHTSSECSFPSRGDYKTTGAGMRFRFVEHIIGMTAERPACRAMYWRPAGGSIKCWSKEDLAGNRNMLWEPASTRNQLERGGGDGGSPCTLQKSTCLVIVQGSWGNKC